MTTGEFYRFRLYVAGDARNSAQALGNLSAICAKSIPGHYAIEVIDVFSDAGRALADGIFMTPTLVRIQPGPVRRVVGTLSDAGVVMREMGLVVLAA